MTPFRKHYQKVTAQLEAQRAADDSGFGMEQATGSEYELMLLKLAEDRRRLKATQSQERKIDIKREILPEYAPYISGVLASAAGVQDEVLVTVMIWCIDTGDYSDALAIADYVLAHGLHMPDQYARTTATVIAEEFADVAKHARDTGGAFNPSDLLDVARLTEQHDMPDQVRSKLFKEIGLLLTSSDPQRALESLRRALQLNDKAGVKNDIAKLEKSLNTPPDGG